MSSSRYCNNNAPRNRRATNHSENPTMIDTRNIPASLYDRGTALPNVYYVTINSATHGQHHLYIAADTSGSAASKVKRHCREHLGFVINRTTSDLKMRRFRLGDYFENPQGLASAIASAALANERDTVQKLSQRHAEVDAMIAEVATTNTAEMNTAWADIEAAMAEQLKALG